MGECFECIRGLCGPLFYVLLCFVDSVVPGLKGGVKRVLRMKNMRFFIFGRKWTERLEILDGMFGRFYDTPF